MYGLRIVCKKKVLYRMSLLIMVCMFGQLYWITKHDGGFMYVVNKYAVQKTVAPNVASSVLWSACNEQLLNNEATADIYTYDLPEITNYSFVQGKRFNEYVIPVMSEKEAAYGPNLDPVTILIIPFSHVDPGYGNTMEGYYSSKTKSTLDNMVTKLEEHRNMTFQWAEVVFLERWWRDITEDTKNRFRALVKRGQIEIVLGGWVMPDEASTHYMAVVDQLIEGHQWIYENLNVIPRNSWSNDPFGFSSTMPYLWKKAGMENMVILRIHQAIKATLMRKKSMEFYWRQLWSNRPENEILCHLMPYRGYWIGDTCGPYNQHICREYAFMHENPIDKVVWLTEENLKERSRILYEQYRITAEIFRRHQTTDSHDGQVHLYVPIFLGEDFSFYIAKDYELIYKNYKLLMDFINGQKDWKMTVKYGTLDEYFKHVRSFQMKRSNKDGSRFPTLAGDFFPYSDYQNDYWTGYYTTRPFNKQLSRELQNLVRIADIFHSYAVAYSRNGIVSYKNVNKVSENLKIARRELGMFLHHDGITGTSVLHVVSDFQIRLFKALTLANDALRSVIASLLEIPDSESLLKTSMTRMDKTSISSKTLISVSESGSKIIIANPSGRLRKEVVTFDTNSCVTVTNSGAQDFVQVQTENIDSLKYRVSFEVELDPFSVKTYLLKKYNNCDMKKAEKGISGVLSIENESIRVLFNNKTGLLQSIKDKVTGASTRVVSEILLYTSSRSGAYIFAPAGPASVFPVEEKSVDISVVRGSMASEVRVVYPRLTIIWTLYNVKESQGKGLHISTKLAMDSSLNNKELVIRFSTDINNGNIFYTDQNGFQLLKRKTYPTRAVEENFYPLTTMAMLEDGTKRFTLHLGQPLGGASLNSGSLEVMLDRRVSRDDNKGLGQGVTDNVLTNADFVINIEQFTTPANRTKDERKYTVPSVATQLINEQTLYPLYSMFVDDVSKLASTDMKDRFNPMNKALPCGLSVVNLRTLTTLGKYKSTSLILHKLPTACSFNNLISECSFESTSFSFKDLFPALRFSSIEETTLTHLDSFGVVDPDSDIHPPDNELRSFQVRFVDMDSSEAIKPILAA